eukprot:2682199-Prymnesium_polylepis.1
MLDEDPHSAAIAAVNLATCLVSTATNAIVFVWTLYKLETPGTTLYIVRRRGVCAPWRARVHTCKHAGRVFAAQRVARRPSL